MYQSSLPLPYATDYPGTELIIGESNALAVKTVLSGWNDPVMVLSGEEGSGKTLLAMQWQHTHHAKNIVAPLSQALPNLREDGYYLLDPLDLSDEVGLFHLLNAIKSARAQLLICSRLPAESLPMHLPDLASRMRAARGVSIAPPDDAMLQALFVNQLSARQLRVEPEVITYALTRLPRSFSAVINCVEKLDHLSLQKQRSITLPLTREILHAMEKEYS